MVGMETTHQRLNHGMTATAVKRCVRCIMPENYPGIAFDAEGVCNFCRYFENHWDSWVASAEEQARSEAKLRGIFDAAKRKGRPYDALIGISGGKDSSYGLYLCHKVYGLKVLTFTMDNGFLSDDARHRIQKLVETFGVPHLYHRDPLIFELASVFMRKTGHFCAPCELATFNLSAVIARDYNIPLIVLGSSGRTDGSVPKSMNPWDPAYFAKVLKGEHYQERLRCSVFARNYVVRAGLSQALRHRRVVILPDYVEWDEKQISELFARDFGINFGEEHSDCSVFKVADYLYRKKCGGYGHKVLKYSMLIRGSKMSREEALERLDESDGDSLPPDLGHFLQLMGMTREEFDEASERSPDPYMRGLPRLYNALRRTVRRQV